MSKMRKIVSGTKRTKAGQDTSHLTIEVPDMEADIFSQLIKYIHCGTVTLDSKSVVGKWPFYLATS